MHPNVVRLYGCCVEGNQLFLVYEYMKNNNLARALFGPKNLQLKLDWPTRQRIYVGISKGLAFLHDESTLKIVHQDIKTNNILLDKELNPKFSDFGLAKLDEEENTHISTRVARTIGYMALEYALWGYLTFKADVYSFGIMPFQITQPIFEHPSLSTQMLLKIWDFGGKWIFIMVGDLPKQIEEFSRVFSLQLALAWFAL